MSQVFVLHVVFIIESGCGSIKLIVYYTGEMSSEKRSDGDVTSNNPSPVGVSTDDVDDDDEVYKTINIIPAIIILLL